MRWVPSFFKSLSSRLPLLTLLQLRGLEERQKGDMQLMSLAQMHGIILELNYLFE